MDRKALDTIRDYGMLDSGDRVVVGISGGADSCALLHFLCTLRNKMSLHITACHINHGLRGAEALRDEQFVRDFCERLEVPLSVLHADIRAEAQKRRCGLEECGREVRYAFFRQKAAGLHAKIATAHTASDNAETVLLHLLRGSGIRGLSGIPPVRDSIIRPLLFCTRDETEAYCRANGIDYVTDSSNLAPDYTRNRLRLEVLPVLTALQPSLPQLVGRTTEHLRQADDFLTQTAEQALHKAHRENGYDAELLQALHPAVLASAAGIMCRKYTFIPTAKHIELIRHIVYNGGAVELTAHLKAVCSQNLLRLVPADSLPVAEWLREVPLAAVHTVTIGSKVLCLKHLERAAFDQRLASTDRGTPAEQRLLQNALDADTLPPDCVFRTRREGDRMTLLHRGLTKTIKKLFVERKIPREKRGKIILLGCGSRILWVEGVGPCRDCAVTNKTKKILVISDDRGSQKGW